MSLNLETQDDVVVLTIDRPPVNALDLQAVQRITAEADALAGGGAAGLVITGAGGAFCAGVDVRAFGGYGAAERGELILAITGMLRALYALPFPVVSAVNGHAMGGGFVLMLAGDVRLALDDPAARLGLQEAKAGVPFPIGALEVIQAELSPELLRRLPLTSAAVTTAEMHAAGVVDGLAPREALLAAAIEQARALADQPAFRVVKRQVRGPLLERLTRLVEAGEDPLTGQLGG